MQSDFWRDLDLRIELLILTGLPSTPRTQYRGANASIGLGRSDLEAFRALNGNLLRIRLRPPETPSAPVTTAAYAEEYLCEIQRGVQELAALLPVCAELDLGVLVAMHRPPGWIRGEEVSESLLFQEPWARRLWLQAWQLVVAQLVHHDGLWGYDLLDHPRCAPGVWRALAGEAIDCIRRLDTRRRIVVQAPFAAPSRLAELEPFARRKNVVYAVHVMAPREFTRQPLPDRATNTYPGVYRGEDWNFGRLRAYFAPVRRFQQAHGVPILLSEIAVSRWAPGALAFLQDVVRLAERYAWDWCYNDFRGPNEWDLERGFDPDAPRLLISPQGQMLRNYLIRNRL